MAKKSDLFWSVWPTALGPMGAVMGTLGITRVVLPHYMMDQLQDLLSFEHPTAVRDDNQFVALERRCQEYFDGKKVEFLDIPVELPAEKVFGGKVLRAVQQIPYGQTRSYHQIALAISQPDSARAVAAAIGKNPTPLIVPCHRVLYADGRLGGFSCPGGEGLKLRMLDLEKRS